MKTKRNLEKYLDRYSEKEIDLCKNLPDSFKGFDYCVAVPLYSELDYFDRLVESIQTASLFASKKILILLCVNNRINSSLEAKESNKKLLNLWRQKLSFFFEHKNLFGGIFKGNGFLFVDRSSKGHEFSEKEGVGLARKITCDIATFLSFQNKLTSSHIITTDGDAFLPENFFILPNFNSQKYVLLSSFIHDKKGLNKLGP